MKLRTASRNLYRYVRHDLREIVWPSSLANPPGYEATRPPRLTLKEHLQVSEESQTGSTTISGLL